MPDRPIITLSFYRSVLINSLSLYMLLQHHRAHHQQAKVGKLQKGFLLSSLGTPAGVMYRTCLRPPKSWESMYICSIEHQCVQWQSGWPVAGWPSRQPQHAGLSKKRVICFAKSMRWWKMISFSRQTAHELFLSSIPSHIWDLVRFVSQPKCRPTLIHTRSFFIHGHEDREVSSQNQLPSTLVAWDLEH